jgi:hypothetical protein
MVARSKVNLGVEVFSRRTEFARALLRSVLQDYADDSGPNFDEPVAFASAYLARHDATLSDIERRQLRKTAAARAQSGASEWVARIEKMLDET